MKTCKRCRETFEGDDCFRCKTKDGITPTGPVDSLAFEYRSESDEDRISPAYLVCLKTGQMLPVSIPICKFGRDPDCDISVGNVDSVSRVHFLITFERDYFYIMDLGSTNGSEVNGKVLTERIELTDGSRIQAGDLAFQFVVNTMVSAEGHATERSLLTYLESHAPDKLTSGSSELRMTVDCRAAEEFLSKFDKVPLASAQPVAEEIAIDYMETKPASVEEPDYCQYFLKAELARLQKEREVLNEAASLVDKNIRECEGRISSIKYLSKVLLTGKGDELIDACAKALTILGWEVRPSGEGGTHQLLLTCEGESPALARIASADPQSARMDLAKLVNSQVEHWRKHENEPKGLLILGPTIDGKPVAASGVSSSDELNRYATQRQVCLVTTAQLLRMSKDIVLSNTTPGELHQTILVHDGRLPGFQADTKSTVAV